MPVARIVTRSMNALTFVASIVALVCLVVLAGYDNNARSVAVMHSLIRAAHIIFIVNVIYNLVINFTFLRLKARAFRWVLDIFMLLTLLPMLYPRPENPWIPWLGHVLYSPLFNYLSVGLYSAVVFCTGVVSVMGKRTNPSLILGCSFLFFIIAGSFLLMMPNCTNTAVSYVDSLFLSTSAVSITGLSPVDISATFTPLGLLVLALLIQIGGLGVLTFTSFFALFFSGRTSIYSQLMVRDMVYTRTMSNLLPTLLYILLFTLSIEFIGAIAIFLCVHGTLGVSLNDEIIFSAFHSLTAFMNAGFSNLEGGLSNPVLLHSNQSIYIVVSVLILAGSIGFPILVNLKSVAGQYVRRFFCFLTKKKRTAYPSHIYDVNTRIVLVSTLTLYLVSAVLFFLFEHNNSLRGMSGYEQAVQSAFNSFVPRSSGFASVSPDGFLNITIVMMIVLMWIGGASQSTAGGIKVNTLSAVLLNLRSVIGGNRDVTVFNRRISLYSIRRANAVVTLSIIMLVVYAMVMISLEPHLPVKQIVYETVSALFTVGSSLGITAELGDAAKLVLCTAMFLGRVGLLSLLMGIACGSKSNPARYPSGDIIIN